MKALRFENAAGIRMTLEKTGDSGMSRLVAGCLFSCVLLSATCAAADAQGPPAASSESAYTLDTIVVTGSYIRRTNAESPSPVTTIDADQIAKSGLNSIADVIRTVSADNSGTLSQAFSGAMAGGADGVALRGLTVDATLVLVDGHRMANYPLSDDGQRQFVDIDSLPMAIVDRVEVLKDGASATYGSDAIAGVVNVILKKQFTGVDVSATAGSTDRGDGLSQRFAATWGTGNLDSDGHNLYVSIEGRHQQAIPQLARGSYVSASDLTPWGGPNLYGGVVTGSLPNPLTTYTVPGQVLPVSGGVVQDQTPYQLPGCSAQDVARAGGPGNGCAWDTNAYKKLQPRTAGLDLSTRWTQRLGGWTNALSTSYYLSQAEQYRQPNAYNVGIALVPFAWAGALSGTVNQFNPATTRIVLPSNSRDNPFNPASPYFAGAQAYYNSIGSNFSNYVGDPALFFGALTNLPGQHTMYGTDVYRIVDDLTNTLGAWDVAVSVGYVRDVTRITYQGFLYVPALYAALANGYFVGQDATLDTPAQNAALVPETHDTATSDVAFVSATGSRRLFALPGGEVALAAGLESRIVHENNPGEPYALQGDILMDGSFYARGSQSVSAAFAEIVAPVLSSLEIDAAGRVDHYNTSAGTAFTPKVGFKWTVIPQFSLRGTYAQGFRAPGIAESGNAGSASSVAPAPVDPVRCPVTNAIGDCGGPGSSVALLTRSNPDLKPEKSRSYTFGAIIEPVPRNALTVDYFYIRRDHEIAPAPYSLENAIRTPAPPGSALPGAIIEYLTPYVNASYSITSGIDVGWKTMLDLGRYGLVTTRIDATHIIQQQQTFGDVTYHFVGTVGPTALSGSTGTPGNRGSLTIDWTRGALSLGTTLNYRSAMQGIDPSLDTPGSPPVCLQLSATNPHCYVAGFGYANVYGQYQVTARLQVMANVTNVTNRLPPLDTVTYGGQNYDASYDQAGAIGRFIEASVRYRF
jgi:iron complex outermembrane receptor protein